jgi:hypothetical protein
VHDVTGLERRTYSTEDLGEKSQGSLLTTKSENRIMGVDLSLIPLASSEMDVDLQRLKRQADTGDVEALRRYCHVLERVATNTKACELLPLDYRCHAASKRNPEQGWSINFSHTVLPLGRNYDLWEKIEALPQLEVSEKSRQEFSCYLGTVPDGSHQGESGYGNLLEDCYGNQLQWVTAGDLVKAFQTQLAEDEQSGYRSIPNESAAAYLAALEPDNPVALHWS